MQRTSRMLIRTMQTQWWMPFILLAMLAVGCTEGNVSNVDESKQTGAESTTEEEAGQLELLDWDFETDEYEITYVVGIVENNTASYFDVVTITFGTYDADGFKLGEAFDAQALRAGEKWKFEAMILEDNAVEVKVISLEGF